MTDYYSSSGDFVLPNTIHRRDSTPDWREFGGWCFVHFHFLIVCWMIITNTRDVGCVEGLI